VQVLQREATATNEALKVMNNRMGFFERITIDAMKTRARLDDRADRHESRLAALEQRRSR